MSDYRIEIIITEGIDPHPIFEAVADVVFDLTQDADVSGGPVVETHRA